MNSSHERLALDESSRRQTLQRLLRVVEITSIMIAGGGSEQQVAFGMETIESAVRGLLDTETVERGTPS